MILSTVLTLLGCITVKPPNNPLAIDDDGDGYTDFEGDCDDSDPNTFPGSVSEATSGECMKDSDGDGFGDVNLTGYFDAGTDCDDSNPLTFPGAAENESSTECLTDEDEDGWSAEIGDCNDSDASTVNDMDCDGVLSVDDCDDNDASMPNSDMDCDGVLSVDDCDDGDAGMPNNDMDCDGVLSVDDCDDSDASTVDDMDCDGVLGVDDCDDNDPLELSLCMSIGNRSFEAMLIPSGTFTIGCTSEQGSDCGSDESPIHQVTLSTNFYMMKSEVTQGLYQQVMGNNPSGFSGWYRSNRPVEKVSWYDAVEFANALSATQGLVECYSISGISVSWSNPNCTGWRLPTEAEWEYAARGGESYKYAGSNSVGDVAWYTDNSGGQTHEVCGKARNGYGLCDMSGNVYEWVWDYLGDYSGSSTVDPTGPTSGSVRVVRSGSWFSLAQNVRVSNRESGDPTITEVNLGFRVARTSP